MTPVREFSIAALQFSSISFVVMDKCPRRRGAGRSRACASQSPCLRGCDAASRGSTVLALRAEIPESGTDLPWFLTAQFGNRTLYIYTSPVPRPSGHRSSATPCRCRLLRCARSAAECSSDKTLEQDAHGTTKTLVEAAANCAGEERGRCALAHWRAAGSDVTRASGRSDPRVAG